MNRIVKGIGIGVGGTIVFLLLTAQISTPPGGITGLRNFTSTLAGTVPASGGGTTNFIRADGTWAIPPGVTTNLASLVTVDQTLSGGANVTSQSLTTGNVTVDCGLVPLQFITNGGVFTITAPTNDGSCMLLSTNNASAGTISFSGFSVGASTGDALDTTSGHKFTISIWRINGTAGYRVAAHQ